MVDGGTLLVVGTLGPKLAGSPQPAPHQALGFTVAGRQNTENHTRALKSSPLELTYIIPFTCHWPKPAAETHLTLRDMCSEGEENLKP